MTGSSKQHIMRIVLVALLFQFVSPVFLSVVTKGNNLCEESHGVTIHPQHSSIIAPQLLKEKDETESKLEELTINLVTLIDFTNQSSALTESHNTKIIPLVFSQRFDHQPPLFTLHRVFII